MKIILGVYLILLFVIGGIFFKNKPRSYSDFIIAGRRRGQILVLCSLMATMIGGSATFGIASQGWSIGFPAFWWLGVGSIGLFLQSRLISERVRKIEANTLPQVANITVGQKARFILSAVIVISWLGVIAGQFAALGQIVPLFAGNDHTGLCIFFAAAIVIAFTAAGGQFSVMRTDTLMFFFIFLSTLAATIFLKVKSGAPIPITEIQAFNDAFSPFDLLVLLFVIGGTYFIGPDVLSRSMAAKDGITARRASLFAAIVLLAFNCMMIFIILWARENVSIPEGINPLVYLMNHTFSPWISLFFALGLISALLSSASTCLITTAGIIQNDLIRKENVTSMRCFILLIGIVATILALSNSNIISLLTGAYSVYAPGLVFPLCVAIRCYPKHRIKEKIWIAAVIQGSCFGILGNLTSLSLLPFIGMLFSLFIALASIERKKESQIHT